MENDIRKDYKLWRLATECVPIMIRAFKDSTVFLATDRELIGNDELEVFTGRLIEKNHCFNYIKVTNDERRRLLPILYELEKLAKINGKS